MRLSHAWASMWSSNVTIAITKNRLDRFSILRPGSPDSSTKTSTVFFQVTSPHPTPAHLRALGQLQLLGSFSKGQAKSGRRSSLPPRIGFAHVIEKTASTFAEFLSQCRDPPGGIGPR